MKEHDRRSIGELLADPKIIEAAIHRAVRDAVLTHARLGHAVPTWRDGRVVWLQPHEVFDLLSVDPTSTNRPAQ